MHSTVFDSLPEFDADIKLDMFFTCMNNGFNKVFFEEFQPGEFEIVHLNESPYVTPLLQTNGFDCGLYALQIVAQFACYLWERPMNFEKEIPDLWNKPVLTMFKK